MAWVQNDLVKRGDFDLAVKLVAEGNPYSIASA